MNDANGQPDYRLSRLVKIPLWIAVVAAVIPPIAVYVFILTFPPADFSGKGGKELPPADPLESMINGSMLYVLIGALLIAATAAMTAFATNKPSGPTAGRSS